MDMLPLKGASSRGSSPSSQTQSSATAPAELDVGARGVEVDVVRHHVLLLHQRAEQEVLGRAPLVAGDHVPVAGEALIVPSKSSQLRLCA